MNVEFLSTVAWSRLIRPPVASCTSAPLGCRSRAGAKAIATANGSPVASRSASGRYPRPLRLASARRGGQRSALCLRSASNSILATPAAVGAKAEELKKAGYELLHPARTEPWGLTVARLQSPEGAIVGISYIPMFHDEN